jgi:16S rRNA (guanine527-N7)-methyltransferase
MTDAQHSADGRGTGPAGPAPVAASRTLGGPHEDAATGPAREVPVLPPVPASARAVFGDRLALAEHFAEILADTGTAHGLIGPREVPILWDRHLLNCAVVHEAFPAGATICDIGSGAGLPGLALAIARPDLRLHLVEPMLRRTQWLQAAIDALGLTGCTVHRGRAEDLHGELSVPYATARAVARIDKLARWTFPLLEPGGTLVALKGSQASEELAAEEPALRRLGMTSARVVEYGANVLEVPTMALELTISTDARHGRPTPVGRRRRTSRRGNDRGPSAGGVRPQS